MAAQKEVGGGSLRSAAIKQPPCVWFRAVSEAPPYSEHACPWGDDSHPWVAGSAEEVSPAWLGLTVTPLT